MESGGKDVGLPLPTAEEEALKRNTDCVYFLASPLTCKKGNECEYRHSEGARVNPRDCWFWLNGNCLNPKCSFRHPPLDGFIGIPTTPGAGRPSQAVISTRAPTAYPSATQNYKQSVPCYYFQKGSCLKGDMCSFMHGPTPSSAEKSSQSINVLTQLDIPRVIVDPLVVAETSSAKPVPKEDIGPPNGLGIKGNIQSDIVVSPKSQTSSVPISSGNTPSRHSSLDDGLQDGMEADDFFHESSPGFDVLVDNEIEDPSYYHDEEEFRDGIGHDRRLNPAIEFGQHQASDNDVATQFEMEQYNEMGDYGPHIRVHDSYVRAYRGASAERIVNRSSNRRSQREENPSGIDGTDLRHQLLKRRCNRPRSGISRDQRESYRRDHRYAEEYRSRGLDFNREEGYFPSEATISKRLQGRLALPRRITADKHDDLECVRETERGRSSGRFVPGRPTNHKDRLHEITNWRKYHPDVTSLEKKPVVKSTLKDEESSKDFPGPKSLLELKIAKSSKNKQMKPAEPSDHQDTETCFFEGPKSLNVILKRKREASIGSGTTSSNEENNHEGSVIASATYAALGAEIDHSLESEKESSQIYENTNMNQSLTGRETFKMDDGIEDLNHESYDQGDEEFDYEEDEGEYDNTEAYQENVEYLDDEDGNDFAEKVGVTLT